MATYDPVSTATALAENYVYARQLKLDNSSSATQSKLSGVTSLKSALTTFTSALTTLSSKGGVVQNTTKVSNTEAAKATASSSASAGEYTFHVTKLASAQQSLFTPSDLGLGTADAGEHQLPAQSRFVVSFADGQFMAVDLSDADANKDGKISVTEMARAINAASNGKVQASVMTNDGESQLILNAGESGKDGAFAVHMLGASDDAAAYVAAFRNNSSESETPVDATLHKRGKTLSEAQNAEFVIGNNLSGVPVSQSSNVYKGIDGLTVEFKTTASPITVSVAKDEENSKNNMQNFVSAYNNLLASINKLTTVGNAEAGASAGALASDSGVRSLKNQLNTLLRTSIDGVSLSDFGITSQRDGTIKLDEQKFAKKMSQNPQAIDELLGKTATLEYQRTGILGKFQSYLNTWTSSTNGLLKTRQDNLQKIQNQYTKEQTTIDRLYDQAYQRYLSQFSTLAGLENQMNSTTSMLSSMFAAKEN